MKKLILLLIFLFCTQAVHANFIPQYTTSINYWGVGAVLMDKEFSIYENENEESKLIKKIKWDESGDVACSGECGKNQIFTVFYPSKNYVILSAEDEYEGWAKVYYDQKSGAMGWVKLNENTKFLTWGNFITVYGKKHGYYLFKDIKKEERRLYAQPKDGAQSVDSWEMAKNITPWFVRGNWLMAKVLNFDNTQKTGWLKWRDDDGKLRGFVDLKN